MSAWIKWKGFGNGASQQYLFYDGDPGSSGFGVGVSSHFEQLCWVAGQGAVTTVSKSLPKNVWVFFTVTLDNYFTFWINGQQQGPQVPWPNDVADVEPADFFWVGGSGNDGEYFNGSMASIQVINSTRS